MTMLSYIFDASLAMIAVMMLFKGAYGATRQLALAPLLIAVLDASFAGVITYGATPIISVLLTALQLTIFMGSVLVFHHDRVRARNKHERRRRRREILRTQLAFEQTRIERQTQCYVCA